MIVQGGSIWLRDKALDRAVAARSMLGIAVFVLAGLSFVLGGLVLGTWIGAKLLSGAMIIPMAMIGVGAGQIVGLSVARALAADRFQQALAKMGAVNLTERAWVEPDRLVIDNGRLQVGLRWEAIWEVFYRDRAWVFVSDGYGYVVKAKAFDTEATHLAFVADAFDRLTPRARTKSLALAKLAARRGGMPPPADEI